MTTESSSITTTAEEQSEESIPPSSNPEANEGNNNDGGNNNNNNKEGEDSDVDGGGSEKKRTTLSHYLSDHLISSFLDPDLDVSVKIEKAKLLQPYLEEIDGYWSFSSVSSSAEENQNGNQNNQQQQHQSITEGQLPPIEWQTHFRKSYTILLWVRPTLSTIEKVTTIAEDNELIQSYNSTTNTSTLKNKRILYRFANHVDDDAHSPTGVCVTVGDWRAIEEEEDEDEEDDDEESK